MWEAAKLEEHRCRKLQAIFARKGDNQKAALVKKFVQRYLKIPQGELAELWNSGVPLLNRLLYADLESLPNPTFEKLLVRFLADEYLLRVDHNKLARIAQLIKSSTRSIKIRKYLSPLLERSVYNAFHYEVCAFAVASKDAKLEALCATRLKAIDKMMRHVD